MGSDPPRRVPSARTLPRPARASQDVGSFVCGFPLSGGVGKCLFGERTVLNLVFKTAFFSSAKRVRMNVRNGKSALPLLPPADRSRLELFLRFADEEQLCREACGSCRWLAGGS